MLPRSGGRSVIVVHQTAQTLLPLDRAGASQVARLWFHESVAQTLVWALLMIMCYELGNRFSQRASPQQAGQSHTKSALSDQLAEEAVVPARTLKLEASGTLVLVGLNRVQSHAAQNRQIGGGVILACAGLVLPHHH